MKKFNKKGFTLIELLVVIAIIGLLSTLAVVALNNARSKSRDAKRVADIKQIQTALEMYYNQCDGYPSQDPDLLSESDQAVSGVCAAGNEDVAIGTYMQQIPVAATPADNTCSTDGVGNSDANPYTYVSCDSTGTTCDNGEIASYVIEFCLGQNTGQLSSGALYATPSGISNNRGNSGT